MTALMDDDGVKTPPHSPKTSASSVPRTLYSDDEDTLVRGDQAAPLLDEKERPALPASSLKAAKWLAKALGQAKSVPHPCATLSTATLTLLPSFLWRKNEPTPKSGTANSISALDGLRGLACLFVFNEHLTYNIDTSFLFGYGVLDHRCLIQWPFVRIFWSGFSMVSIFFVISGYVLSYKPLQHMRAGSLASFYKALTSSVFRRAFRLYIPSITAVLICGLLAWAGAFDHSTQIFASADPPFDLHEAPPPLYHGFFAQMADATVAAFRMLNIWAWTDELAAGDYDLHLWTIVVEFRTSMVLFLVLIAVSRLTQFVRLFTAGAFLVFCIATERKEVFLFIAGMSIADLDLIRKSASPDVTLPTHLPCPRPRPPPLQAHLAWLTLFVTGLYLCSAPVIGCEETPGFQTLAWLVPPTMTDKGGFLRAVGAVCITWSAVNSAALQPIFSNAFTAYLGKISFALYLVHGNVLKTLGFSVMPAIYSMTNDGTRANITTLGLIESWILCAVVVGPVTFWLADVFWRGVDVPSVRFAGWVEEKLSAARGGGGAEDVTV